MTFLVNGFLHGLNKGNNVLCNSRCIVEDNPFYSSSFLSLSFSSPQTEVRQITKKISFLNEKLDSFGALVEPRENAFIRFLEEPLPGTPSHSRAFSRAELETRMGELGFIHTSTTFPSLCTVELESCTVNLACQVTDGGTIWLLRCEVA